MAHGPRRLQQAVAQTHNGTEDVCSMPSRVAGAHESSAASPVGEEFVGPSPGAGAKAASSFASAHAWLTRGASQGLGNVPSPDVGAGPVHFNALSCGPSKLQPGIQESLTRKANE